MRENSLIITGTTKHASKSKPSLLLRDYLRDDLSSCSSSGFKSLPRRQCCTTVGFRLEKDLKLHSKKRNTLPKRRRPALQRASEAVINAVKSLPLYQKSVKTKKATSSVLSRSFSRKLLSRSFWGIAAKEEGSDSVPKGRRSFRELLVQERDKQATTSFNEDTVLTTDPSITNMSISSGCGSNSWGESEFTFSTSVASSDSSTENDLVEAAKDGESHQHKIQGGVTTGVSNSQINSIFYIYFSPLFFIT